MKKIGRGRIEKVLRRVWRTVKGELHPKKKKVVAYSKKKEEGRNKKIKVGQRAGEAIEWSWEPSGGK